MTNPKCILLFSGKRKSGKDYLTEELVKLLRPEVDCVVIKISAPIKSHYAETHTLSLDDLMGSGEYKERYRADMIRWSDQERAKDPAIFCREAVNMYEGSKRAVWIVSDIRRKTDIMWFQVMYENVKTIRVQANEQTRLDRGYVYTEGVDNVQSECDLDDETKWDWCIDNSTGEKPLLALQSIVEFAKSAAGR